MVHVASILNKVLDNFEHIIIGCKGEKNVKLSCPRH
jgi:hypothetical protein